MPEAFSQDYVSVNLRRSFLVEDHPDAEVSVRLIKIDESDVPAEFQDPENYHPLCVEATVTIPGHRPVVAVKEVPRKERRKDNTRVDVALNPETWNKLRTQAVGRALKAAGYPDKLPEFTAVVAWRKRNLEIEAMRRGIPVGALAKPEDVATALAAAATTQAEAEADVDDEPDHEPDENDDGVIDAEVVDTPTTQDAPSPLDAALAEAFAELPTAEQQRCQAQLADRGLWKPKLSIAKARQAMSIIRAFTPRHSITRNDQTETSTVEAVEVEITPEPEATPEAGNPYEEAREFVASLMGNDPDVDNMIAQFFADNKTTLETATGEQLDAVIARVDALP